MMNPLIAQHFSIRYSYFKILTMDNLVQRIDVEIERRSLLKHKFYRLWSEGKLDLVHLKGYSSEYFQLVKAVPLMVDNVLSYCTEDMPLRSALQENRREETEHIELWKKFSASMGIKSDQLVDHISSEATNNAVNFLIELTKLSLGQGAAAMYAYEKQLPEISRSKIDGLKNHYGIVNKAGATEYFEVHEKVDIKHAAVWKGILDKASNDRPESLLQSATESLRAQNRLLDSVYERYIEPVNA
jgi:pyrroloquinoline-quinone synthase